MDDRFHSGGSDGPLTDGPVFDQELQHLDGRVRELLTSERAPEALLDRVYRASVEHLPSEVVQPAPVFSFVRRYGAIAAIIVVAAALGLAVIADRTGMLRSMFPGPDAVDPSGGMTASHSETAGEMTADTGDGDLRADAGESAAWSSMEDDSELYASDEILLEASRIKARLASATRSMSTSSWGLSGADAYLTNATTRQVQDAASWLDTDLDSF